MIKNYFKIALRQLGKQKMYALIKIGGFALSIAACLLISLYIRNEMSFDKSYPNTNRIFRIVAGFRGDDSYWQGTDVPAPTATTLKALYPQVEATGRIMDKSLFWGAGSVELKRAGAIENTHEEGFAYADQSLLDILELPMVYGDRRTALSEPFTMVISKSKADKYYPNQNPVGKVMYINNDKTKPYRIGAVMHDFPATSHLKYSFFLTLTAHQLSDGEQTRWTASNYRTYVLLKPGADAVAFEKSMKRTIVSNIAESLAKSGDKMAGELRNKLSFTLQNISDINLKSYDIQDEISHGDIRFIWLFSALAAFILIIACFNFINLSTAKSANRAKEVGLRKVVGSLRSGLIVQFLIESLLYSSLSFMSGLVLAALLLPYFNILTSKSLVMPWQEWWLFPIIIVAAFITGVAAGIYPAFYLSGFKPVDVLKGRLSAGSKSSALRNGLVVFQFTISIILIIGTIVIYSQMEYILNKKVGFDKDQVVMIQGTNTLDNKVTDFKNELQKISAVGSVSVSDYLPVDGTKRSGRRFWNEGKAQEDVGTTSQMWQIDKDYLKTLGMQLVAGRNFAPETHADSHAVIINQTLANNLNLKNAIGKRITNDGEVFTVIGVVHDFNYESLRQGIHELAMHLGQSSSIVSVKIKGHDVKNTLAQITAVWKEFSPGQPIRYTFMDETFASMYADVQRMRDILTTFAVLAVVIACLGLFALAAFMAEQRSKEVGIRKVLGASIGNITALLSFDFVKLVVVSIVIATPIAWWAMAKWLQDFTYRIDISWWMVAMAAGISIFIAMLTVSYQSIKAALTNPIKSLKAE
ncbi:ABC transporter permease [Mucilaginibacter lappiensis]|uniref:ABC transporter permease n=1 Tax=Mucilaginibacter lappiensis TaxID=354630 RepID=UPI003D1E841C